MDSMQDYWISRRTIRRYSNRSVDRAELSEMLLKASHAPTTGNMQLYSVVVTDDVEGKRVLFARSISTSRRLCRHPWCLRSALISIE